MSDRAATERDGEIRLAVVVSRFNRSVTDNLLEGAMAAVAKYGLVVGEDDVFPVPGAFELPLVALAAARRAEYHAVVCLGAVIRGETPHFDHVCAQAATGIREASLSTGKPIAFGVLTTDDLSQALARAGGAVGNKGYEAVVTAVETLDVLARLRSPGRCA